MSLTLLPIQDWKPTFDNWFLVISGIMAFLNFITNMWSACKIWKTFNLNMAPYLMIFLDAGSCAISGLGTGIVTILYLADIDLYNQIGCSVLVFGYYVSNFLGQMIYSLLSITRFHRLAKGKPIGINSFYWTGSIALTILVILYLVSYVGISISFDLKSVIFYEFCAKGQINSSPTKFLLLLALPNQVSSFLPLIYDIKTYRFIQSHTKPLTDTTSNNQGQMLNPKILQIPLRATLFSTVAAPISLFYSITAASQLKSTFGKAYATWFFGYALTMVRNPIVTNMAFKANEENKAESKASKREQAREVEINEALEMRELRKGTVKY